MSEPHFSHLADLHALGGQKVPAVVRDIASGVELELVWRNELGGLTFRCADRFIKWNPRSTGIDLERERVRLEWISARHPAPRVVDWGEDESAQWMVTAGLPGEHAVGDRWRARRPEAIRAIATGLRAIHAVAIDEFPQDWTSQVWVGQRPESLGAAPPIDRPVLVHGDACAPNTLISPTGAWVGHVDFGDLAVGDPWADLAIASMAWIGTSARGTRTSSSTPTGSSPTKNESATTATCGSWPRSHVRHGPAAAGPASLCRRTPDALHGAL